MDFNICMSTLCHEKPAERCLLVLCGLPASGKTTLGRHLLVAGRSPPWRDRLRVQVVTFDGFLELDTVQFDPIRWKVSSREFMRERFLSPSYGTHACRACLLLAATFCRPVVKPRSQRSVPHCLRIERRELLCRCWSLPMTTCNTAACDTRCAASLEFPTAGQPSNRRVSRSRTCKLWREPG